MHVYQNGDDTDNRNDLNLLKLDADLNIYADDSKLLKTDPGCSKLLKMLPIKLNIT